MESNHALRALLDEFPVPVAVIRCSDSALLYANALHRAMQDSEARRSVIPKLEGATLDEDVYSAPILFEDEEAQLVVATDGCADERTNRDRNGVEYRYRSLVDMSPNAILVHQDGRILYVNPSGLRMVGAEQASDALGKSVLDFVSAESAPTIRKRLRALQDEGVATSPIEVTLLRLDKTTFPADVQSDSVVFDEMPAVQTIVRDLSLREMERTAREMAESEARAIVDSMPLGLHQYTLEDDGRLVFVGANEAADRILGIDHSVLVGLTIEEAFPSLMGTPVPDAYREVALTGEPWEDDSVDYDQAGRITGSFDVCAFRTAPGAITVAFEDTTDRKRSEEAIESARRLLRDIIDTVPVRVFWKGRDLRYQGCNVAFARDAGMEDPDDLIGKDDFEMGWSEQAELYQADDTATITTGEPRLGFEEPQTTPDGDQIILRTSKVPLRNGDGEIVGVLGVYDDITELKLAELELERYRHHLEEVVEERTRQLEEANAELERADQAKSAFLASMSHELRTPLNSVIGFSGVLAQGLPGPLNSEQMRQVKMIYNSGRQLLSLVNDVLDLERIEVGRVELVTDELDVRHVVDSLIESVQPLALEKGLDVASDLSAAPERMIGDRGRLEQIVLNLLSNAIKYTEDGSVSLEVVDLHDGTVRFSVTDTGIGIAPEYHDWVFEAFHQLPSSGVAKSPGSGLGLAISRDLATILGGTIGLKSEVGTGSTFSLVLPIYLRSLPVGESLSD